MTPRQVTYADLQIGDVIRPYEGEGYRDSTVYQIKDGYVHLVRPYIQTADFIYTGGVITHFGQEDYTVWVKDAGNVTLLYRRSPEETRDKIRGIVNDIRANLEKGKIQTALDLLRQL